MRRVKFYLTALWALVLFSCAPEPVRVTSITLDTQAITLQIEESFTLTATVSPHDASNTTILWSSDNASVAKVSDGTVTAVAPGKATITAKSDDGALSDKCVVTVPEPIVYVTGVSLDQESVTLKESEWFELNATVFPENADDQSLQWSSSDPKVIQVTSEGVLFALSTGTADVTVTTVDGEFKATCKVTVKDKVTDLTLEPPKMDLVVGDEADIMARLEPEDANVKVTWKSADPEIAEIISVNENGQVKVKALATGDAVICAATDYKGLQAFCKIHVRNKVESLVLDASSAEAYLGGDPTQLTATVTPADLPDLKMTWSSSDTSVATVDGTGNVSAKKKGKVTITVTVENGSQAVSKSCEMQVIQPVTSINVTPKTLELFVDEVIEINKVLTIETGPDDADDTTCKYTTSAAGYITVSQGKITGVKAGPVTLNIAPNKANPKTLKATCKVTVKARVASITVTPSTKTLNVGQTLTLTAKAAPSNASQEVTWNSSDDKVAKVDNNGEVTALKAGEAVIKAVSKENAEIYGSCTVTVVNIPVTSVTLNKTTLTLVEGKAEALTATVKPDNVLDKTVTWKSSDEAVATVSSAGLVTAKKAGTANITASCGGKTATCVVTVDPPVIPVTGVSLDKEQITIYVGSNGQLTATVLPEKATNKNVTWSSSNTSIVTVISQGNVAILTGRAAGEATVTVKTADGEFTKECKVTVNVPVSSITLSQTTQTLEHGQTFVLDATILPASASGTAITWSSDKPTIASVDENGVVTAGSTDGTAIIKATCGEKTATCTVTVVAEIILVRSITIKPSGSLSLSLNETTKLTAVISPSNATNKSVIWSVPQGAVASVDQEGNVTAVKEGSSRIIVKSADGNAQAQVTVTVTKVPVSGLTLTTTELTMKVGETYDLDAKVYPSNASITTVTYTTSKSSVATVDKNGRVTAKGAGTATITVKPDDKSAPSTATKTCKVTVLASGTGSGGAEGIDFEEWNFE